LDFYHGLGDLAPLLFAARIIDGATGGNISTAQAYMPTSAPRKSLAFDGLDRRGFGLGSPLVR
jgi:hypothetical protein